ncbi:AlbA family DNA-binding domain-containing protein [Sinomicrobium sp. M5D2P9]
MNFVNYFEEIFQLDSGDITIDHIIDFFSEEQEETSILEFKTGEVEIIKLYDEISAFLNTEGGLIIVGSPREKVKSIGKNKIKVCQGDLEYSKFRSADWLQQKIVTNITPPPLNIEIKEFLTEKGNVFLINVPQSLNPPHQSSSSGKYYIRLEKEAKPAPHGLVKALFNKRRVPQLEAEIEINRRTNSMDEIICRVRNESEVPADKVSFLLDIYNVNDVESDEYLFRFYDDELGKKYSTTQNTNQVLVQVIHFSIPVLVKHRRSNYLVMIAYWSRDTNFDCTYRTYSPTKKEILSEGHFEDRNTLIEELKKLN